MTTKEFDEILNKVGSYNVYQFFLIFYVAVVVAFFNGLSRVWVFITMLPKKYWCHVPGRELTNYSEEEWKNLTIPISDEGTFERCHYHPATFENDGLVVSNESKECFEWDHTLSGMEETIATSKGWLCDKEMYSSHMLAAQLVGTTVGCALLPILADRFIGRRKMFFVSCGLMGFFTIPLLFANNIWVILVTRFIAGSGNHAAYQLPLIICLELVSPDKRAFTMFLSFFCWGLGSCGNGLVGWILPHWWSLTFATFVPFIAYFLLWFAIPESPRFLLAKGRYEECTDVMMKIANKNKKEVCRMEILQDLKSLPKDEKPMSYKEIFQNPRMVLLASSMCIISFLSDSGYMAVIFNVKVLPDNYFLGNFIISATEIPSNIIAVLFTHYLGRKAALILSSLLLIPFCSIGPFYLDYPNVMLVIGSFIKSFNSIIIFVLYVITPELFPTPVRSSILGIVILGGMFGQAVTPYLVTLEVSLISWILFAYSLAMLILSLPLTETIGLPLPQTFMEADNHIKSRPLFRWIHFWNKDAFKPPALEDQRNGEKHILKEN